MTKEQEILREYRSLKRRFSSTRSNEEKQQLRRAMSTLSTRLRKQKSSAPDVIPYPTSSRSTALSWQCSDEMFSELKSIYALTSKLLVLSEHSLSLGNRLAVSPEPIGFSEREKLVSLKLRIDTVVADALSNIREQLAALLDN